MSGCSPGKIIQLKNAPNIGMINFQVFRLDTLTPGRCNKPNQIVIAKAETIASHPKE